MRTTSIHRTALGLALALVAVTAVACGDGDPSASGGSTTTVAVEQVYPEGHQQRDGSVLAVGAATPTDPQGRAYLHPGDRAPDVELLQERLEQLGADISDDGVYGDATLHAVLTFQRAEGLVPDGVVGSTTWAKLDHPTAKVVWTDPDLPDTYADSKPTTTTPSSAPTSTAPAGRGDAASVTARSTPSNDPAKGRWSKAVVSLSAQTATFYDSSGAVALVAPVSSGHDGLTPQGTFHVQSKSSRAFAGNGVYMDWMTRFDGGVGFHSIPKRANGSDIPTPLGQAPVSHGCIRMADAQAKQVYDHLPVGAVVEVHP